MEDLRARAGCAILGGGYPLGQFFCHVFHHRRDAMLSALLLPAVVGLPANAAGMDRYVKKKQLDPLDTYIPPLLKCVPR